MEYTYYPGCSLTGSARKLDKGVRSLFKKLGHSLKEIPDWNCCGALEYGDRKDLIGFAQENLKKAEGLCNEIVAPCPACYKNLKDGNSGEEFTVLHPLEIFTKELLASLDVKRDLKGMVFTPYYGCVLLRPEETAIKNKNIMEELITFFSGEIEGEKIRDRCCGGGQLLTNKWATEKLTRLILDQSKGILIVFCPLCEMALKTFSKGRKILYLTDLILYLIGEKKSL